MSDNQLDIATLRDKLAGQDGSTFWRSLDEIAETEAFQDMLHREFPEGASEWNDEQGRRRFLKLMGASLAAAGLSGCLPDHPDEKILPYVEAPENWVPAQPMYFSTAFVQSGYAIGALVESHGGRPTKIEGNPSHPASLGATNAFMQASILDCYDPDRSQGVLSRGRVGTWANFVAAMATERRRLAQNQGAGLRLLTGTVTSPTLARQIEALQAQFPQMRWHRHDPAAPQGTAQDDRQPLYRFAEADTVVSLGADFLLKMPGSVRYARDFADRRRVREGETAMNRLYALETAPTITGSIADHRLARPPSRIERVAEAAAAQLGASGGSAPSLSSDEQAFVDALAGDLQEGRGLVVAGATQPLAVQRLARAMNEAIGAVGQTVEYAPAVDTAPTGPDASLRALTRDMAAGRVETLLMLGGNPSYTAPADVPFADALAHVPTSVHLSLMADETSFESTWHVPRTHFLEAWSDARAFDGTATIMQPLIAPLYAPCHSAHEVLSILTDGAPQTGLDLVQRHWRQQRGNENFAALWEQALYDGVVPGTGSEAFAVASPSPRPTPSAPDSAQTAAGGALLVDSDTTSTNDVTVPADTLTQRADSLPSDTAAYETPSPIYDPPSTNNTETTATAEEAGPLELAFTLDPSIWDGRFANNAWLHELPKPITKLVWDNAALLSPSTAEEYGLSNSDVVTLSYRGRTLDAPVWIVAGHADGCVTVALGYGRTRAGSVGDGVGFDAYRLRTADAPWGGPGLSIRKTDQTYRLVSTQTHFNMEGRDLVRAAAIGHFREKPDFAHEGEPIELPTLLPEYDYDAEDTRDGPYKDEEAPLFYTGRENPAVDHRYKWGMVIDQNVCIGCNACVTACQSENNIPVVGKEQVGMGREMHWLRIDRYHRGTLEKPETFFQPVPCMQCEKAPCELVCPVAATVHDAEGLNVMVYNRCIGTRYCSNNCPYKVRRFNFLLWQDWETESLKLRRNPDVTVRSRGVMEKCTYCLQRISSGRIAAEREDRRLQDGEILTACQQACPTRAISFGDLNDADAEVTAWHDEPHNYALLGELGTRPRTTYLAHFRNPAEALAAAETDEEN